MINKHELSIVRNNQKRMVKVAQKVDLKKSLVDLEHVQKLIAAFDSSKGVVHNPLLLFNINEPFNFLNLDVRLLYLRRVHSYCYYSGVRVRTTGEDRVECNG